MIYNPHILQRKAVKPIVRDEYGRIVSEPIEYWEDICPCRCDDNTTQEFKSENGHIYRPKYHVVCERNNIKSGDVVRCISNNVIKGEGKVVMVKNTNYFGYTEIWM